MTSQFHKYKVLTYISLETMNATIFGGPITILQSIVPLLLCLNICSLVLFWLVRGREQICSIESQGQAYDSSKRCNEGIRIIGYKKNKDVCI